MDSFFQAYERALADEDNARFDIERDKKVLLRKNRLVTIVLATVTLIAAVSTYYVYSEKRRLNNGLTHLDRVELLQLMDDINR